MHVPFHERMTVQVPEGTLQLLHSLEEDWIKGTSRSFSRGQAPLNGGTPPSQTQEEAALPSQATSPIGLATQRPAFVAPKRLPSQKRMRQIAEGFS